MSVQQWLVSTACNPLTVIQTVSQNRQFDLQTDSAKIVNRLKSQVLNGPRLGRRTQPPGTIFSLILLK